MKIAETKIALKDGRICHLRSIQPSDAQAVLSLMQALFAETNNLTCYPDEFCMTVAEEEPFIAANLESEGAALIGAFVDGVLVGDVSVSPLGTQERLRHRCSLGIGIVQSHWGLGIATALMDACLDAAWEMEFELVQLDVVSTNEAAIALYKKFEFEPFGLQPHGFKYRDGSYADLLHMQRSL